MFICVVFVFYSFKLIFVVFFPMYVIILLYSVRYLFRAAGGFSMRGKEVNLERKKWYQRFPHTYVVLFFLIIIATILTWIIPAGAFDRAVMPGLSRAQVVPNTYHRVAQNGVGLFKMFLAIPEGLIAASNIIFLIMMSTAAFAIIRHTGALDNGIGSFLNKVRHAKIPGTAVIWIATFLFSLLGVVVGPEIQIPFTVLGVSIALGLGYDAIVGLGIVCGGGYAGFNFGPINASIIGSSHAIMGMPVFSGQGLRWILWIAGTMLSAFITSLYAKKIAKNPKKSLVTDIDTSDLALVESDSYKLEGKQAAVLIVLLGMLVTIIVGAAKLGWYLNEMTCVFIVGGLVAGYVYGYKTNEIIKLIQKGVADASAVALIVGIARGIQVVLEKGKIMDTIIYTLSSPLQGLNPVFGLIFISIITALIHFIIPSGSGLAFAVMPIIGPLGILIGCTPQATVLAFQIGATVPNYLYPTIGATMAELGIARVPIDRWWKYAWKLTLLTFLLGWVFLFIASAIGY